MFDLEVRITIECFGCRFAVGVLSSCTFVKTNVNSSTTFSRPTHHNSSEYAYSPLIPSSPSLCSCPHFPSAFLLHLLVHVEYKLEQIRHTLNSRHSIIFSTILQKLATDCAMDGFITNQCSRSFKLSCNTRDAGHVGIYSME